MLPAKRNASLGDLETTVLNHCNYDLLNNKKRHE